jgi:hypothetical protein
MLGQSENRTFLARKMCVDDNLVVVSMNYRLAPEWTFLTGIDDCVPAYRWVLEQGETLGADARAASSSLAIPPVRTSRRPRRCGRTTRGGRCPRRW